MLGLGRRKLSGVVHIRSRLSLLSSGGDVVRRFLLRLHHQLSHKTHEVGCGGNAGHIHRLRRASIPAHSFSLPSFFAPLSGLVGMIRWHGTVCACAPPPPPPPIAHSFPVVMFLCGLGSFASFACSSLQHPAFINFATRTGTQITDLVQCLEFSDRNTLRGGVSCTFSLCLTLFLQNSKCCNLPVVRSLLSCW
jgi:hypothetical protein